MFSYYDNAGIKRAAPYVLCQDSFLYEILDLIQIVVCILITDLLFQDDK